MPKLPKGVKSVAEMYAQRELLADQGYNMREIAAIQGVCHTTIWRWCTECGYDIPTGSRPDKVKRMGEGAYEEYLAAQNSGLTAAEAFSLVAKCRGYEHASTS